MIIDPSPSAIRKWAYQKSKRGTIPNWDEVKTARDNAELFLTLASDPDCPQRAYALNCLYLLVGNSVSVRVEGAIQKITILLDTVSPNIEDPIIKNWVTRSRLVLRDLKKFDYREWCAGGFVQRDLPQL